jgi:hypothetical protein
MPNKSVDRIKSPQDLMVSVEGMVLKVVLDVSRLDGNAI